MTVCNFFLQGRCRYGEKCWNEHPRGGSGGGGGYSGGYGSYNRPTAQSSSNVNRGGGGFGNKVWVNPSQRSSGRDYVQSSSFPKGGGSSWGAGGGGGAGGDRSSSSFSFASENKFSSLSTQPASGHGDDNDKYVETVSRDMESWANSGQWPFSCYSPAKASISGFTELAPEELRLEYYTSQASGGLQNYANAVQQLASQWRSRVQELKNPSSTTRAALIAELANPPSVSSGFPSAGSVFGAGFGSGGSQATVTTGFGSAAAQAGPAGFGSAPTAASFSFSSDSAPTATSFGSGSAPTAASFGSGSAPTAGSFGSSSTPTTASFGSGSAPTAASFGSGSAPTAGSFGSGSAPTATSFGSGSAPTAASFGSGSAPTAGSFGSGSAPTAASFSFAAPVANKDAPVGFGATAAGFSFSASAFGASVATPPAASGSSLGQPASGAGPPGGAGPDQLFTPRAQLSAEELKEFSGKRFNLGQVPLRPPPADLLVV